MSEQKVITIIRDHLFAATLSGANRYQTIVATIEKETIFEEEIEVVKRIVCVENQQEFSVPLILHAKDLEKYVQYLIGTIHGSIGDKRKTLN